MATINVFSPRYLSLMKEKDGKEFLIHIEDKDGTTVYLHLDEKWLNKIQSQIDSWTN